MGDNGYGPPSGYALRRNGTCTAQEELCSHPWGTWYNCCPEGTHCTDSGSCCPTPAECSAYIDQDPHCANNATWDLYLLDDGQFCCLSGKYGFVETDLQLANGSATSGVGCADGLPDSSTNEVLVPAARGNASESTSSSPTPSATNSNTPTPTPSDDSSSGSNNAGAIAGGVVGGCAGLALILALVWFLLRRRRQQATQAQQVPVASPDASSPGHEYKGVYGGELQNNPPRSELSDNRPPAAELYGNQNTIAHELPANPAP